jgi:hypothetical protein
LFCTKSTAKCSPTESASNPVQTYTAPGIAHRMVLWGNTATDCEKCPAVKTTVVQGGSPPLQTWEDVSGRCGYPRRTS